MVMKVRTRAWEEMKARTNAYRKCKTTVVRENGACCASRWQWEGLTHSQSAVPWQIGLRIFLR